MAGIEPGQGGPDAAKDGAGTLMLEGGVRPRVFLDGCTAGAQSIDEVGPGLGRV